jgi:hypothetical protein
MCHAVRCRVCGNTTWAGCGLHVDQVMARVPADRRCAGHTAEEMAAARGTSRWRRLFGGG